MITIKNNYFKIDTLKTTYLFKVNPINILEHIYYGPKINTLDDYSFFEEQQLYGGGIVTSENNYQIYENCASLEYGTSKRSDAREAALKLSFLNNDHQFVLKYQSYKIIKDFKIPSLPCAFNKEQTLVITLEDKERNIKVNLYYSTYSDSDVITCSSSVLNCSEDTIRIERIMSLSFDFIEKDFNVVSLNGAWGKERQINITKLNENITKISSNYGFSSAQTNPFVMLKEHNSTNNTGLVIATNLVYSGNHATSFERNSYHKIRMMVGINDYSFSYNLKSNEIFYSPEATICLSNNGVSDITSSYHDFINNHIIRSQYKNKVKPILINNWEGTYFNFNEDKLLNIAKIAKSVGIEMFVLDDGWFGHRDDDTSSLGDWYSNQKKLPNGVKGLCEKIHNMGLKFGLWIEPEMISKDSDLYNIHPNWIIKHPLYSPLTSRNQFVLDLTNKEVVEYLSNVIINLIKETKVDYIKWDCNRNIGDYYSSNLENQEEFSHRYILGLYQLLDNATSAFSDVLFESCASGGNRVDLGMLYYMPQFWCSDNTDHLARFKIQQGTLLCYPQSTIGAHVSSSLSKQTLRFATYDNKFNAACIGAFGYEIDITKLTGDELEIIKDQVQWYKQHRNLLQFGKYYQINEIENNLTYEYMVVSIDKKEALYFLCSGVFEAYATPTILKPTHLDDTYVYTIDTKKQYQNPSLNMGKYCEEEHFIIDGHTLMNMGVRLSYEWISGNGKKRRIMEDFGSRIYHIKKKDA